VFVDLNQLNLQCSKHIFLKAPNRNNEPMVEKGGGGDSSVCWPVYPSTSGVSSLCETAEVLGSIYDSILHLAENDIDFERLASHKNADRDNAPKVVGCNHKTLPTDRADGTKNGKGIVKVQSYEVHYSKHQHKHMQQSKEKLNEHFAANHGNKASAKHRHRTARAVYGVKKGNLDNVTHMMLLINGGQTARLDVLHAVRMEWDVVVFKGSGGFADELVAEQERRESAADMYEPDEEDADDLSGRQAGIHTQLDSTMEEILEFGKVYIIDLALDSVEVSRLQV
jgi:hypothetical protein